MKEKILLKKNGWSIECESPLEIRHEDGSFATEQAARYVIDGLCEEDIIERYESIMGNYSPQEVHRLMNVSYMEGIRLARKGVPDDYISELCWYSEHWDKFKDKLFNIELIKE